MLHKLIESVTTSGALWTLVILVIGFGLVKWFAWMARKEEEGPEYPFEERDMYR